MRGCEYEEKILVQQKEKIINMKKNVEYLKEKYKRILLEIEEIEKEIGVKISKIKIEIIKETDIKNYV